MARYLIIDPKGKVINAVEWSGDTARWRPPEGCTARLDPKGEGDIGDTWDGAKFTKPVRAAPRETKDDILREVLNPAQRARYDAAD